MSKISIQQANRLVYAIQQAEEFIEYAQKALVNGYSDFHRNHETASGVMTMQEAMEFETGKLLASLNFLTGSGDLRLQNVATYSQHNSNRFKHLVG